MSVYYFKVHLLLNFLSKDIFLACWTVNQVWFKNVMQIIFEHLDHICHISDFQRNLKHFGNIFTPNMVKPP